MAKLVCTDHEDLYKNMLKPRMKVGNDFVTQVRNKYQVTIKL
jgi:myosin heavy subunit